jgi:hypothetical protein
MRAWHAQKMEELAAAVGLPPLRTTRLVPGDGEARIRTSFALGAPNEFLRLTVRGQRVDGELYLYWSAPDHQGDSIVRAFVSQNYGERCTSVRPAARTGACRLRFAERPNWKALWFRLDSLGIDRLAGGTRSGLDGYSLTLEYKGTKGYRLVSYWSPQAGHDPDESSAAAVYDLVQKIAAWR